METQTTADREDIEETIAMAREILSNARARFPEHLLPAITAALARRETHGDMTRQLMRLCAERGHAIGLRFVDGKLLYKTELRAFVWGSRRYCAQDDYQIVDVDARWVAIVGGMIACIEVSTTNPREMHVVWNERVGRAYPGAIHFLQDCGGVPCYAVYSGNRGSEYESFVVLDETEGEHFFEVSNLTVVDGKPLYVGRGIGGTHRIVWGTETQSEGAHVSSFGDDNGTPFADVTATNGTRFTWKLQRATAT